MENLIRAIEKKYQSLKDLKIDILEDGILVQYDDGKGLVWNLFNDTKSITKYLDQAIELKGK